MGAKQVSVIIPSYNHSNFIIESVDSVLRQTYGAVELIIIDDGSTDDTRELLKSYEGRSSVRVVYQENRGAPSALNRGIALAKGAFISILNSDDVYHPERIEECVRHQAKTGADMVFTDLDIIDRASRPCRDEKHGFYSMLKRNSESLGREELFVQNNIVFTTSNLFLSRSAVKKIGLFRDLRYVHDWDWILRCQSYGSFAWLRRELLSYRSHDKNTIDEGDIWRQIIENAFIIAAHLARGAKMKRAPLEELAGIVFRNLMGNTSFFPVPTLLFLWMLSGGYCTEDELLARLNDTGFMKRFMDIVSDNRYDIKTMLSPYFLQNYFVGEKAGNIIARIIRKLINI